MEPVAGIVVALIAGPIMWFLTRFDRRNSEQHANNQEMLTRIDGKVDRLDGKVDRLDRQIDAHLVWHDKETRRA